MKNLTLLIAILFIAFGTFAQNSIVTINYKGQNKQIWVDGIAYEGVKGNVGGTTANSNFVITVNNLRAGRHTLEIKRNNVNRNTSTAFNLRNNYDMTIEVSNDGSVQLKESYRKNAAVKKPMTQSLYNQLLRNVRNQTNTTSKMSVLHEAFSNTNNYYTTVQARQLIQQVAGETYRLDLARTSLRGITDFKNINLLNALFASQATRTNFTAYAKSYSENPVSTNPSGYRTPMADATFETLLNDIRNRWQAGAKYIAVSNAFNMRDNYFSTAQAIQLIQMLSSEQERLQLAKLSYRTIVDPAYFSQVYQLFGMQSSKNELAAYINSNGSITTQVNSPMADAAFNTLLDNTRRQWLPGAKKSAVIQAFENTSNYFTVYQVSQLVQLDNDEADRLDMAKASLRSLTDPGNIVLLFNIFTTPSVRAEFTNFVNNFNSGTNSTSIPGNIKVPVDAASFTSFLNETRSQWLPGAKKAAVIDAFSRTGNYFTTDQARQLIALDNDEDDRLDMAKASYKTITDPQNFSQVYSLFTNQSYLNDLVLYVKNFRY